jgi:hypothetical protein
MGAALIQKTREQMGSRSMLVLLSAPKVVAYIQRWALPDMKRLDFARRQAVDNSRR